MIIGICGFIGSGKSTVSDYLTSQHNFTQHSFAASLKDSLAVTFGWDREMLEGSTEQSRNWREEIDTWWAEKLSMPTLTPRWVMQYWGTDVCRNHFHDSIWIASLENKLRKHTGNIVVSDCRFTNEIAAMQAQGAKMIWVQRGELPDWYNTAESAVAGHNWALNKLAEKNIHPSEYAWVGTEFDAIINNNGSIAQLYQQIDQVLISDQITLTP